MKTRKYKTLRGLLSQCRHEITYNDFHANQFIHKDHGWCIFSLPESEKMKGYELMASAIYRNGKQKAANLSNYYGKPWGILTRLWLTKNGRGVYCCGQDWNSEMRILHGIFRRV